MSEQKISFVVEIEDRVSGPAKDITTKVSAANDALTSSARKASVSTDSETRSIRALSFAGREGKEGISGLSESFRENERAIKSARERIAIYLSQAGAIAGSSGAAANSLRLLTSSFAGLLGGGLSGGLLIVVSAATTLLRVFREINEEANILATQRLEAVGNSLEAIRSIGEGISTKLVEGRGLNLDLLRAEKEAAKVREEWEAAKAAHPEWLAGTEAAERRLGFIEMGLLPWQEYQPEIPSAEASRAGAALALDPNRLSEAEKKFVELRDRYLETMRTIQGLREAAEILEAKEAGKKAFEAQIKNQDFLLRAKREAAEKARAIEEKRIAEEAALRANELEEKKRMAAEEEEARRRALLKNLVEVEKKYREEAAERRAILEEDRRLEEESLRQTREMFAQNQAALSGLSSGLNEFLRQTLEGTLTLNSAVQIVWSGIREAIARVFAETITAAIASAFTQRGIELTKALSLIQMNAAIGGSAAAASAAVFGPGVAITAGTATEEAIRNTYQGMVLAAAAYERGGIVPATQIALLHPKEMVLPREIAEPLARQVRERKNGGVQVVVNLSAIDGESVSRFVASREFSRAIRSAIRNGRL